MNQLSQMCQYKKHQEYEVQYVCLDANCEEKRLFCSKCMLDNRHNHGQGNNEKILDQEGLQAYIQFQLGQLDLKMGQMNGFVKRCLKLIKTIYLSMSTLLDKLQELQSYSVIKEKISLLQNQLDNIRHTKLNQIDDQFICQLINMEFCSQRQSLIQEINEQCDAIMQNSVIMQKLSTKEIEKWKLADIEYEIAVLDQQTDQDLYTSTISNNLKYIISSRNDSPLKIWNYSDYKLTKECHLNDRVQISKFTDDSMLLYIGTAQGTLYRYEVQNNFKETYKERIHFNNIVNLYCISNYIVLTSSFDRQIIKTDTQFNQELLKIEEAHDNMIHGLDYHRQKDVIVSCSNDDFIKLWDNSGSLIIKQQNPNKSILSQVLFINNDQLISLDSKANINIWLIKYESRELKLINTIKDVNKILNVSLVLNQQYIILICKDYLKFYTIQGQHVGSILHNVKKFYMIRQIQLDSMKSIVIQGRKQLKILKMKI